MSEFVARHKPEWDELDELVRRARRSIRAMSPHELSRLDVLYRQTAVQLAQVATRTSDAALVRYLNDLTAAAHSVIYLPPRKGPLAGTLLFLREGFARAIVQSWRYHLVAATLVIAGALLAYFAARNDPTMAYALVPQGFEYHLPGRTGQDLQEALRQGRDTGSGFKFFFASFLFQNNLKVGLASIALGVLAGIPTIYMMLYNGMILGAITATYHGQGIYAQWWAWILPHGITEIGAIILCGGVGLRLGRAVINPGLHSRAEALRRAGSAAGQTAVGVTIMLVLAAMIESYLRQSNMSTAGRFVFAAVTAVFWALYITHGVMRQHAAERDAAEAAAVTSEAAPQVIRAVSRRRRRRVP